MTQTLDILAAILAPTEVLLGGMPASPDTALALQEVVTPPATTAQWFGGEDMTHTVQLRSRSADAAAAYAACEAAVTRLNRYHDNEVSILLASPILDAGWDNATPPRREYTANLTIRRF
jgi:hypothetical protein